MLTAPAKRYTEQRTTPADRDWMCGACLRQATKAEPFFGLIAVVWVNCSIGQTKQYKTGQWSTYTLNQS